MKPGSGKTEAALILAQRMLEARKGRGLFLALPTMATADAMFRRASDVVGRLFRVAPSLTLAHGRARLSVPFHDIVGREAGEPGDVTCAPWLADTRRRALLADVGVGTVDQALLAAMPTRFATLRLWGLASKILIVDEVHEMGDPYMAAVLRQLLYGHAMLGGSAILMTATLPLDQRAALISAFRAGAGQPPAPELDWVYPALTVAGGSALAIPAIASLRGPIVVRRLPAASEALNRLVSAVAAGAACVWIRNAVDDAIAAVQALRQCGVPADLLHARFALTDRKRIEAAAVDRFGKDRPSRVGRVLVATQVVESSLDLDFDVMVSDLAPMASLVQRAGRLWRHMDRRPRSVRPVSAPELLVLSPDPGVVTDARWLHGTLDAGAWVYDAALQWRTAEVLFREGQIDAPQGLRALIEAVHGPDALEVAKALQKAEAQGQGEALAKGLAGQSNVVDWEAGYRDGGGASNDRIYPTRLGQPQRVLMLARQGPEGLRPWADGADAVLLSQVQASLHRLDKLPLPEQRTPDIMALTRDWPDWQRAEVTVCPVAGDGRICEGLRYEDDKGLMFVAPP